MKVLRTENHQNGHWLHQAHPNEKARNGLHSHPPDHPGDCPTGQTPAAVAEVEEVAAADDDRQITMIQTKVQIQTTCREQKTTLTRKGRVKAPLSTSPAHPQGMTGERLRHPGGTEIPHMGER